jgi:hypothetical protein
MAMNYFDYPDNWEDIRAEVLKRAKNADGISQCECLGECGREHKGTRCPHLQYGLLTTKSKHKVILTTAHLCHTPKCDSLDHLKSMCQPCHQIFDLRERQKAKGGKARTRKSSVTIEQMGNARSAASRGHKIHMQEGEVMKRMKPYKLGPPAYLARKKTELSEQDKQQIRARIEAGDGDVYKLAAEFGCVPTQVAAIKAWMHM